MDNKFLKVLLDLRIALGELSAAIVNIDKAINGLMALEIELRDGDRKD
uniref:Uncharacterized protein n=1 Tax=viral metagenome TaxID=1070528 RepID=A0A6M3KF01_9ZZZZ